MTKVAIVFILASCIAAAQNFQPPAWSQGQGAGRGQGAGQGQGQGQGDFQHQIDQLQAQIQRLRAQQRQQQNRPHVDAQSGMVVGHPLSGKETRHTTQTLTNGTVLDRGTDISYFYRDAQGRMRAEGPNGIEIFDPVAHMEYEINPAKKAYSHDVFSGNVSFVSIAAYGNSTHSNISTDSHNGRANGSSSSVSSTGNDDYSPLRPPDGATEDLGRQMVNGVMAKGSRVTITIPAGSIGNNQEIKVVNERWYSDDLQVLVKSTNNDPRFGINAYDLTDIKQTAPDPSLFTPPSDYTLTSRQNLR